ncbi:MAG: B12-binding domain-containing radical SAM protein, partial [Gammaproteobacteria bacterium]|nr:B12-binding domain-containing radical SAM protein [Gammaproteobacteria bacterium]
MPKIVLATINARHIHASLGLRCLLANMGDLQSQTEIREFTLESRPVDIAEQLLAGRPAIIGLGIYIWNCEQSTRLVSLVKAVSP